MDKYINQQTLQNALERKQCGPANQRYTDGWNDCLLRVKSMVSKAPAADVAPIEALERLRDELCAQDLITMEGLRKLNTLIGKYTPVRDGRG